MKMNVEFLMAARSRIVYEGRTTLAGAMLDKADDDGVVIALESAYSMYYGNKVMSPLDTLEHKIAALADKGASIPVSNPEAYAAAQWAVQAGINNLPNPMPRAFALYFAKAMHEQGQADTVDAALTTILTTKQFI